MLWSLPLPWVAIEFGWFLAEFGRQPWVVEGVLPTFIAVSNLTVWDVIITIVGFTVVYGILAVVEVFLMIRAIRKGPTTEAIGASPSTMANVSSSRTLGQAASGPDK